MKLGTLKLNAHMFRIVMSSWSTVLLIRMDCPFLSLLISFSLKSNLSAFRVAMLTCFLVPFDLTTLIHPLL